MHSPALGIAWLLWQRNRWAFTTLLAYGSGVVLLTHVWPSTSAAMRPQVFAAALPLFFGLLYLMAAFAYPEADLSAAASGFPRPMLLLPVRTRELVFWPMLAGCTTLALAWIALARWILIPNGMLVPVGWMAAMLAALLAWLQALCWSPSGLPYLRLILTLLLLSVLAALGGVGVQNGVSPAALAGAYGALILVAYAAAAAGVARARRGDTPEWDWRTFPSRPAAAAKASLRSGAGRPFASPAQAQLWLEWRRNGLGLPLLVAGIGMLFTLPLLWLRDLAPLAAWGTLPAPALKDLELNALLGLQKQAFLWPVLLASIVGCGLRTSDARRKDFTLHPFLATRPMTSGAFVTAKLQMAACSTLAAWGVMLLVIGVWLLTPAREGARTGTLGALLLRHCTPRMGGTLLLGLLVLIGWTWKNQVQGLSVRLTGRRWVIVGCPAAFYGLLLVAFVVVLNGPNNERDRGPDYWVPHLLPWLMGAALALKAVAAGWAFRELYRRRLASVRTLAGLAAAWAVLALGLFALLSRAVREADLTWLPLPASLITTYLAAATALFVPLARLALAPLAMAWNRHR